MKINEIYTENLLNSLPSFYKEFIYNDKFMKLLLNSYISVVNNLRRYAESMYYNTFLDTTEYYRNLEFAVLDVQNALYDVNTIATQFAAAGLGSWFSEETSLKSKVDFLYKIGKYELLDSRRSWDAVSNDILSLDISKNFSGDSGYYTNLRDYAVSNNKLYLFNDLAKYPSRVSRSKSLLLSNIIVDNKKLENRFGTLASLTKSPVISPEEYMSILKGIFRFYINGPTVKSFKEVLQFLTMSEENINIFDRYSNDIPWVYEQEYNVGLLTDFNFIIELPLTTTAIYDKKEYIIQIVKLLKPTYTQLAMYYTNAYDIATEEYTKASDDYVIAPAKFSRDFYIYPPILLSASTGIYVDSFLDQGYLNLEEADYEYAVDYTQVNTEIYYPSNRSQEEFFLDEDFLDIHFLINEGSLRPNSSVVVRLTTPEGGLLQEYVSSL